jgi:hypothetical protein
MQVLFQTALQPVQNAARFRMMGPRPRLPSGLASLVASRGSQNHRRLAATSSARVNLEREILSRAIAEPAIELH